MIHTILDEIKGKILDLQYVERYGGIVVPVSQDVEDEDGRSKRITFPASWDGQGKACYAANDYFELAPNDVYRSVSYWELRGDAVPFVPRRGDRGKWYGFRQSARLVVWLNLQVLGIPETGNKLSDHLSVLTMNALQGAHQVGVDYIDGVRMTVERKVRKSMDIFGAYSYSDRNELLLYPYDFFAIDFQVEWYIKRDCIPGEIPYKALRCAPIEVPGGGAWTPGPGEEECNCRWIDLPDRPTKLSDFENDLPCSFQSVDTLPEDPDKCVIYLHDGKYWEWDGSQYVDVTPESGVMSVTGDNVDNTDPANPVVNTVNIFTEDLTLNQYEHKEHTIIDSNLTFVLVGSGAMRYDFPQFAPYPRVESIISNDLIKMIIIPTSAYERIGITVDYAGLYLRTGEGLQDKIDNDQLFLKLQDANGLLHYDRITGDDIDDSTSTKKLVTQALINLINGAIQSTEKGAANGVAPLDSDQLIPTQYLPPIAINEIIEAVETSIAAFAANSGNYTFETGDVILIDDSGNVQHYLYKGGTKTDVNEYSLINATQIDWSNVLNKPTDLQDNLFTKDLVLTATRTQTLDGVKLLFDIINGGEFEIWAHTGVFTFTNTGPQSTQQLQANGNVFRLKCINNTTFHEGYIGIKLAGSGRPAVEIRPNLENFNSGACKYGKRVNGFDFEWGDIEIPEYADDNAADADIDLVSGAPYSITGDRTVKRKP